MLELVVWKIPRAVMVRLVRFSEGRTAAVLSKVTARELAPLSPIRLAREAWKSTLRTVSVVAPVKLTVPGKSLAPVRLMVLPDGTEKLAVAAPLLWVMAAP